MTNLVPDRNDVTLELVRDLGFDTRMDLDTGTTQEKVFFFGPVLVGQQQKGAHASEDAVLEYISHLEHHIHVAKDYLANGRNNKTHEWQEVPTGNGPILVELHGSDAAALRLISRQRPRSSPDSALARQLAPAIWLSEGNRLHIDRYAAQGDEPAYPPEGDPT